MKIEIFGSTDVGQVRDHNEDNFVLCRDLTTQDWTYKRDEQLELGNLGSILFVADGMGGTNAGEVASEIAQATVDTEFKAVTALPGDDQAIMAFLKKIIVKAHQNIVNRTHEDPTTAGMGTTAVICWVVNDKAYVAWSGDSRMYLYRDGAEFNPITDDHSLVWELVKNGQISPEDARLHENSNIITQSLGDEARPPKPDAKMVQLQKGDRVMLCSDGLSGMVSDNMLAGILSGRLNTADTCKELIQAANTGGGTDNITVILLDVVDGKAPVAGAPKKSINTAIGAQGAAPINTVASKGKSNTGLIVGIVVALVIVAAAVFFFVKPGSGEVEPSANDTIQNPVDTNLNVVPAPVETPPPAEEPVQEQPASQSQPEAPVDPPTQPSRTTTTPANTNTPAGNTSPSGTSGTNTSSPNRPQMPPVDTANGKPKTPIDSLPKPGGLNPLNNGGKGLNPLDGPGGNNNLDNN